MSLLSDKGYLNKAGYNAGENYLGGEALNAQNIQVLRVISGGKTKLIQTNRVIATTAPRKFQVLRVITKNATRLFQVDLIENKTIDKLFQVLRAITPPATPRLFQVLRNVTQPRAVLFQLRRMINNVPSSRLFQVLKAPVKLKTENVQVKRGKILHTINAEDFYLAAPYLSENYLCQGILAWLPFQTLRGIKRIRPVQFQVSRVIVDQPHTLLGQVQRRIDAVHSVLFQVNMIQETRILMQVKKILYNTKRLRVLASFPSRGTTGTNWTASSTASGDFSVNNLNTDIVEQCWRSSGSKIVSLTSDTQITQGVFVDTIGLLGHNLTRSATIEVQGSASPGFTTYQSFFMTTNRTSNWYYVAPKAPTSAFRYWRFFISDTTNPAAYLQIGTIVFGSSIIMTANDITDNVRRSTKHFSDKIATEGFTAVSNDRAVKYGLGVEFQSITYDGDDYLNLRSIFDNARTSLKCLWIPTPEYPERFAVFGKLSAIPEEQHNALGPYNDYINFNLDVDESL